MAIVAEDQPADAESSTVETATSSETGTAPAPSQQSQMPDIAGKWSMGKQGEFGPQEIQRVPGNREFPFEYQTGDGTKIPLQWIAERKQFEGIASSPQGKGKVVLKPQNDAGKLQYSMTPADDATKAAIEQVARDNGISKNDLATLLNHEWTRVGARRKSEVVASRAADPNMPEISGQWLTYAIPPDLPTFSMLHRINRTDKKGIQVSLQFQEGADEFLTQHMPVTWDAEQRQFTGSIPFPIGGKDPGTATYTLRPTDEKDELLVDIRWDDKAQKIIGRPSAEVDGQKFGEFHQRWVRVDPKRQQPAASKWTANEAKPAAPGQAAIPDITGQWKPYALPQNKQAISQLHRINKGEVLISLPIQEGAEAFITQHMPITWNAEERQFTGSIPFPVGDKNQGTATYTLKPTDKPDELLIDIRWDDKVKQLLGTPQVQADPKFGVFHQRWVRVDAKQQQPATTQSSRSEAATSNADNFAKRTSPESASADKQATLIPVKHGPASLFRRMLQAFYPEATILVDERTNSLIVQSHAEQQLGEIQAVLRRLDVPPEPQESEEALVSQKGLSAKPRVELLLFWAAWSQPAREMKELGGKLSKKGFPLRAVNIDDEAELAKIFNVTANPTVVVLNAGKELRRVTGAVSEDQLVKLLKATRESYDAHPDPPEISTLDTRSIAPRRRKSELLIDTPAARRLADEIARHEAEAVELAKQIRNRAASFGERHPEIAERRTKMQNALAAALDLKFQLEQLQIEELQSRLSRLEQQIGRRKALRQKIVDRRVEELIEGEATRWDGESALNPPQPAATSAESIDAAAAPTGAHVPTEPSADTTTITVDLYAGDQIYAKNSKRMGEVVQALKRNSDVTVNIKIAGDGEAFVMAVVSDPSQRTVNDAKLRDSIQDALKAAGIGSVRWENVAALELETPSKDK